jgi:hypothetical protein
MAMVEPLVRGLAKNDSPWCEYVASFLTDAVRVVWGTSASTKAAEDGLGIKPSVYWYIRRVHHTLNHVILFHRVRRDELLDDERGACPFDTGALWSGRTIRTTMTASEKRAYFEKHDRAIARGIDDFETWLQVNHGGLCASYESGERPQQDIPEIVQAVGATAPWAPWAWEVRAEKHRVHSIMTPVGVVWTRDAENSFTEWLKGAGLEDAIKARLRALISAIEVRCEPGESVFERAVRRISELSP